MTLQQVQSWESRLLLQAYEALESSIPGHMIKADDTLLDHAYAYCEQMTAEHSRTFYMASGLLPREQRLAARALYAFCRVTDDIVDQSATDDTALAELERWQEIIMSPSAPVNNPVAVAWADTRARYSIPQGYAEQLINGVARDLSQKRYETFADLAEYSYGVASTVGLMAMHIIGYESDKALPYAVKLGVALQLTNILRDVAEDRDNGRIYLPQEELAAFDLTERDIMNGVEDARWQAFMRYQIDRNRRLYAEALPGLALLNPQGRFAIGAAAELYRAILDDIEAHDYDVFSRRSHVGLTGKLRRLPVIWWRTRGAQSALAAASL